MLLERVANVANVAQSIASVVTKAKQVSEQLATTLSAADEADDFTQALRTIRETLRTPFDADIVRAQPIMFARLCEAVNKLDQLLDLYAVTVQKLLKQVHTRENENLFYLIK